MEDLSSNELFQQRHARTVNGEDLEVMGKRASTGWADGKFETLNDAVVDTVKHAGLSPEQVRRVVEFTNTEAFLREFRKEGSSKYVDFGTSGPADPRAVLQDLNDGGGGSVFDPGTGDYNQPPPETKTASDDTVLLQAFASIDAPLPEHNPFWEVIELRDKLASACDNYKAEMRGCENMIADLRGQLFHNVKQAALEGHSLGEIVNIWERFAPDPEYVKIAFDLLTDSLVANGVFPSMEALVGSLQKTASLAPTPNPAHPMVTDFLDFCSVVEKLAHLREDRAESKKGLDELTGFLKNAVDKGLLQHGVEAVKRTAQAAQQHGTNIGNALVGSEHGKYLGNAAKAAVYAAPAVGAHELYRSNVKYNPVKQRMLSAVPGTQEYNQREYQLAANAQGMY